MLTNDEIKKELLNILILVDKLLTQNELKYSVMSGTLLGTIRHKGFIPWDDDIDIAMPREDYDRFSILIKDGLLDSCGLSAIGYEINHDFWPFIKVLNPQIMIKQELNSQASQCDNLWIDVFPFDYVPTREADKVLREIAFQKKLLGYKIAQEKKFYKYKKNIVKKVAYIFVSLVFKRIPVEKISGKIISLSKENCAKSKLIADMTWGRNDSRKYIPAELFEDITEYTFENVTVKGFRNYDEYLTQLYGDYMKLPSKSQRVNHGIKAWRVTKNEK